MVTSIPFFQYIPRSHYRFYTLHLHYSQSLASCSPYRIFRSLRSSPPTRFIKPLPRSVCVRVVSVLLIYPSILPVFRTLILYTSGALNIVLSSAIVFHSYMCVFFPVFIAIGVIPILAYYFRAYNA